MGLTLDAAAKLVGIQPMSIWRHEKENRTLSLPLAKKYASAYGLTLDKLADCDPVVARAGKDCRNCTTSSHARKEIQE